MKLKFTALIIILIILTFSSASASNSDTLKTSDHFNTYFLSANVVGGSAAYYYMANLWGKPSGKFHLKDELHDNLALTDEISHAYCSYKLTQSFMTIFRTMGMSEDRIEMYAAIEAALMMTLVEYPLDAYNPGQGMGLTDLAFDAAGIAIALLKQKHPGSYDFKVSWKKSPLAYENHMLANTNEEFDNYIWWAAFKPKYIWLGLGYSTNHYQKNVQSEYYLGAGTTLSDLVSLISKKLAKKIKLADTYFINLRFEL